MVKIAFVILCHESQERVMRLVNELTLGSTNHSIIIHVDKKNKKLNNDLKKGLCSKKVTFVSKNVRCTWGTWSLVEGTLNSFRTILSNNIEFDYVYLISEYCRPVQSLEALEKKLSYVPTKEYIETCGPDWIKGGIREGRYLYRHFIGKKEYPRLHKWLYKTQVKIFKKRKLPREDLEIKFGSQWFCITREAVIFLLKDKKIRNFYKWVWVPDESYFQTRLYNSEFRERISSSCLTYTRFDNKGKCSVLDEDESIPLEYYFARKYL